MDGWGFVATVWSRAPQRGSVADGRELKRMA
jgi:hypothetical protein